jgi:hypothetical protein
VRLLKPVGSLEILRDLSRLAAKTRDSRRAAEAWPRALKSMTEDLGATCIVANKNLNSADWVCFSGASECFKTDYVDHFALLDPFLPHLNVAPRWIKLSTALRQSEWYNDFVLVCGVRDTREEAIARASVLAAELTKEGDWSSYAITVTDEDGGVKSRLLCHRQYGENT